MPEHVDFKERFIVSFQQLNNGKTDDSLDSSQLSCNHSYIIYSPYCIFLWHGDGVDLSKRKGSVHVLKAFLNSKLFETINFQPSYLDSNQNVNNLKYRVELHHYES